MKSNVSYFNWFNCFNALLWVHGRIPSLLGLSYIREESVMHSTVKKSLNVSVVIYK